MYIIIYVGNSPVLTIPYKTSGEVICHDQIAALALLDSNQWHLSGLEKKLQLIYQTTDNIDTILTSYNLHSIPSTIWYNAYIVVES